MQLEGELYNGRVAMLAVVGILTVEALGRGPWWQAYNTVSRTSIDKVSGNLMRPSFYPFGCIRVHPRHPCLFSLSISLKIAYNKQLLNPV